MATESIEADNAGRAHTFLVVALFLLGAAGLGTWWFKVPLDLQTSSPTFLFPALVGPLGIVFLVLWARDALRVGKYGTSVLEADRPSKNGAWIGVIRTNSDLVALGDYTITLKCFQVRTNVQHQSGSQKLMWSADTTVAAASVTSSAGIPFAFTLPGDDTRITRAIKDDMTNWYVEIKAPLQGTDYYAIFTVTVLLRQVASGPDLPWWTATS